MKSLFKSALILATALALGCAPSKPPGDPSTEQQSADVKDSAPARTLDQATRAKLADFGGRYYELHDPSMAVVSLKEIDSEPILQEHALSMRGFYGVILREHPESIPEWVQAGQGLGERVRWLIACSLRQCGTDPCMSALRANPYKFYQGHLDMILARGPDSPGTIPLTSMANMEFVVSEFPASGDIEGIRRIAQMVGEKLPLLRTKQLKSWLEAMMVSYGAQALRTYAQEHAKVAALLKEESARSPALRQLIPAA